MADVQTAAIAVLSSLEPPSPMFDYEIRRILEQGTRLMEEAAKPGSTRLLASPLPNPRTRM